VNFATERLLLRAVTRDDAEVIVAEDRILQQWAPDFPTPGDVRIASFALAGKTLFPTDEVPWGLLVIVDTASGLAVGGIGFKSPPDENGDVEIGYGVCESFQSRGVATEAVLAVCEIARRGARAVIAETDRENVASRRVLEKSGFRRESPNVELIKWRKDVSSAER
jgi:RimJ/RimL family protein N-acetyltransferase